MDLAYSAGKSELVKILDEKLYSIKLPIINNCTKIYLKNRYLRIVKIINKITALPFP
jgi:hypothetical protein